MYIVLLMLVFSLVCGSDLPQHVQHVEEITGDWRTIAMAADNVTEIEEDGPRRAYVRAIHCDKGCETLYFRFYIKSNGKCKLFAADASGGGQRRLYTADLPGNNVFEIIHQSSNFMVIYAIYMEDVILNTHLTLALGKGRDLSEEESEKFEELTTYCNIPMENIRYLSETDTCPD